MIIYLAARYSRRLELCGYRDELTALGHKVPARWLNGSYQVAGDGGPLTEDGERRFEAGDPAADHLRDKFARDDLEDVISCEMLVAFTETPDQTRNRAHPGPDAIERWELVDDSSLGYMVSSFGRIRNASEDTILGTRNGGYVFVKPDGKYSKKVPVHQLVAEKFIGACPPGHEIDHVDGFKDNNWAGNLEYVTHLENIRRAEAHGARGSRAGTANGRAKLTEDDVMEIRARAHAGESKASLARSYPVSDVTIGQIVSGKLWPMENGSSRGGRMVELGIAIGLAQYDTSKQIITVGPRENLFCWLRQVTNYPSWPLFLTDLGTGSAAGTSNWVKYTGPLS